MIFSRFTLISKRLLLVGAVLLPIAVFLFVFLKKGAPSNSDQNQNTAGETLSNSSSQVSPSGSPDPQEARLRSESSELDSLRSVAPAGNVEQQTLSLDTLWRKAGRSTVSASVQLREIDAIATAPSINK